MSLGLSLPAFISLVIRNKRFFNVSVLDVLTTRRFGCCLALIGFNPCPSACFSSRNDYISFLAFLLSIAFSITLAALIFLGALYGILRFPISDRLFLKV